ncbi:hypothetical protein HFO39_10585 [Rhizobium leguminosarum]|uniref:hypothetical protein n=1 Tax=Rhizobium leguminosarum TaxID=384 RepID=UPI001C93AA8D|nr:hypothetical protein [Rhizobium leguminosarum]MBY5635221.1 hypothetical protein [Rhizobium leguminosarum]
MDPLSLVVAFLLSLVVPVIVIAIRQTVKLHRGEIIQDLAAVFHSAKEPESERLIPSFEFVKFKYFVPTGLERGQRQDFQVWAWGVAVFPFFLVVSSTSYICIEFFQYPPFADALFGTHAPVALCMIAVSAAFCGGYLNSIRALTQSIQNFDLSPSLIVALATQIFSAVVLAAIFAYAVHAIYGTTGLPKGVGVSEVVAVLAFAIGFFPDAAQRTLIGRSKLKNFKRENLSVYKYTLATPVELIDGIDTEIRNRLSDFHIETTQNLATANPLMLFVETPFGVYQIMDWVAQAQLCASVGAEAMTSMWKLGVRTLFDLERAALDERCRHPELLQSIGRHLLGHKDDKSDFSPEAITANIQMRLDDPHVHRLRQIYMQVGERIGERHWRFLTRDDGISPRSYDATGIVFQTPNRIRLADSGIDIRPNDYLAVVGGKNNGKLLKVGGVDRTLVTVDKDVIDEDVGPDAGSVRLFRINP